MKTLGFCRLRYPLFLLLAALCAGAASSSGNWPSFRGPQAGGVADGQNLPDRWDGARGENIKWKTRIPGLAHSSPVVWGNRLYVTSAISSQEDATFKHGLYGEGDASKDQSVHQWKVYSIDKRTGTIAWESTAYQGVPREKRHIKSTYANSTPATDGRHVIAFFGSQGLYCFDTNGKLIWKKDLGVLDMGAYDAPEYEWGTASSPIIYQNRVIVQCDTLKEDFLLAVDIESGATIWKTGRDELPSWSTPAIYTGGKRIELVTNAPNFIRGYDPETGLELWRLGGSSKITAPTPVFSQDLIVVASGRRPEAPREGRLRRRHHPGLRDGPALRLRGGQEGHRRRDGRPHDQLRRHPQHRDGVDSGHQGRRSRVLLLDGHELHIGRSGR